MASNFSQFVHILLVPVQSICEMLLISWRLHNSILCPLVRSFFYIVLFFFIYIYLVDSNVYSPYCCFHLNVRTFLCLTHICMYLYMYIRSKNSWRARIIKWLCSKRVLVKVPNLFHVLCVFNCVKTYGKSQKRIFKMV